MLESHGRVYDKKYLVLRFDIYAQVTKSKNKDKVDKLRWQYAQEFTQFQQNLIDKFCSSNFNTLVQNYINGVKYKKDWVIGTFDIGIDMLKDEIGLRREYHWQYVYWKIPIDNKELIDFFNQQNFSFQVKQVKTI